MAFDSRIREEVVQVRLRRHVGNDSSSVVVRREDLIQQLPSQARIGCRQQATLKVRDSSLALPRSHMTVEGEVVNRTSDSLRNVAVVITWRDAAGKFITSDRVLIDYNPVLPGQASPFKSSPHPTRRWPSSTSPFAR
jgi:hypothetical protein